MMFLYVIDLLASINFIVNFLWYMYVVLFIFNVHVDFLNRYFYLFVSLSILILIIPSKQAIINIYMNSQGVQVYKILEQEINKRNIKDD